MSQTGYGLQRFVDAQTPVYPSVIAELKAGAKRTHWMWFIFPQLKDLGRSATSRFYGVESRAEALSYWRHAVLGHRLKECAELVLAARPSQTAHDIFGAPDDLKLRSCMTLFAAVALEEPAFKKVLERFYGGKPDDATLKLLK